MSKVNGDLRRGREEVDLTPMETPLRFRGGHSGDYLKQMVQSLIEDELSRRASDQGFESFEDADDFLLEDDDELVSPYEMSEMQEEFVPPPPPARPAQPAETSSAAEPPPTETPPVKDA